MSDVVRAAAEAAGLSGAQIHVVSVDGNASYAFDDRRYVYPASLIKLPLAVAAAADVGAGRRSWNDSVVVTAGSWTVNDAPSPLAAGAASTLGELVTLMIERSDNVATNVLIDLLGRGEATARLADLGFGGTRVRRKLSGALPLIYDPLADGRNAFPAADCTAMLLAIARRGLPESPRLFAMLRGQWWNSKLSTGLLEGEHFAHKTGDTSDVSHDAGILTMSDGARWVITVYTEMPAGEADDPRFGAFLTALRPHLRG